MMIVSSRAIKASLLSQTSESKFCLLDLTINVPVPRIPYRSDTWVRLLSNETHGIYSD